MSSAFHIAKEKDDDLFDRDEVDQEDEDDIFHDNNKFGAIVDDYKRVMARGNKKNNNGEMLVTKGLKGRSRKGTVAPYAGETEMTDLDIMDLEDFSEDSKESPMNDAKMNIDDILENKKPDKTTFIETEHSILPSYRESNDEDECIIETKVNNGKNKIEY